MELPLRGEGCDRAKHNCEAIFAFAIAAGKCKHNPAADVRRALAPKPRTAHFAAVTEPEQFGELLRKIESFEGTLTVLCALRLAPHLPVRPGELRRRKGKILISTRQSGDLLPARRGRSSSFRSPDKSLRFPPTARGYGSGPYVFPSAQREAPMSENAVLYALPSLGIPREVMTGHGFRATFRTIGDEVLKLRV